MARRGGNHRVAMEVAQRARGGLIAAQRARQRAQPLRRQLAACRALKEGARTREGFFSVKPKYIIFAWAALVMKLCKNLAGSCGAPTYLPTYLPTLLMGN